MTLSAALRLFESFHFVYLKKRVFKFTTQRQNESLYFHFILVHSYTKNGHSFIHSLIVAIFSWVCCVYSWYLSNEIWIERTNIEIVWYQSEALFGFYLFLIIFSVCVCLLVVVVFFVTILLNYKINVVNYQVFSIWIFFFHLT